ncbi:MAG: ABC transporter substrate-binding protein [Novosphingobium sp.]
MCALALASCSPAPHGINHAHPSLVSLNPCTDAILAEVADPSQIVALSAYSRDPESSSMDVALARRFPATSGTVEELLALRPDVVVSGNFLAPATSAAMGNLGMRLEQFPIASTVPESLAQVRRLALLAGHPERGEVLVRRIERALTAAAPPPDARPVSTVVWQSGGIVPGGNSLIADLLRRTGFSVYSAARGLRQADVLPLERMLADPPELILAAGNPRAEENRLLAHPALSGLKATRRASLDPALLWCGGPTIIRAAGRLAAVRKGLAAGPPPPAPSSEEEGALTLRNLLPLLFRGGGWGVVESDATVR